MDIKREILKLRWSRMNPLNVDVEDIASGGTRNEAMSKLARLPLGLSRKDLRRMAAEGAASMQERRLKYEKSGLIESDDEDPRDKTPPMTLPDPADEMLAAFRQGEKVELELEMYRKPINDWIQTIMIPKIFCGSTCAEKDSISEWTVNLKLPEPYQHYYAHATAFFWTRSISDLQQKRLDDFQRIYDRRYEESIRHLTMAQMPEKMILILNVILNDAFLI